MNGCAPISSVLAANASDALQQAVPREINVGSYVVSAHTPNPIRDPVTGVVERITMTLTGPGTSVEAYVRWLDETGKPDKDGAWLAISHLRAVERGET